VVAEASSSAEGSGRTIEAAIEAARSQLGVPAGQLDVEVLAEPVPSSFGVVGSPARVRVTLREGAAPAAAPAETPSSTASSTLSTGTATPSVAAPAPAPIPVAAAVSSGAVATQVATAPVDRALSRSRGPRPPVDVDPELATQQAEAAGDFVEGLLELLDLEADITTWTDPAGGHVDVEGPDLDVLVGRDGDTLTALEELTRLAVVRQSGERARVMLDIDGFKQRRREELSATARETAARVRESGQTEELPPMSPYERKVVHDVVAELAGVATESVGEEPRRRVAIVPA
jgi:spoIIIJ-associated protein